MHKSKLQEYCHRQKWELPEYTTIKEGPPHNPRFQTTVTVNDIQFTYNTSCKTTKESQNNAAKLALHTLISSNSSGSSSSNTVQPNIQETNQTPQINATAAVVKDANRSNFQEVLFCLITSGMILIEHALKTCLTPHVNATTSVLKDVYGLRAYRRHFSYHIVSYAFLLYEGMNFSLIGTYFVVSIASIWFSTLFDFFRLRGCISEVFIDYLGGSSSSSTVLPNIQETNQTPQVNAIAAVVKDATFGAVSVGSSSSSTVQPYIQETNQIPQVNSTAAVVKDATFGAGLKGFQTYFVCLEKFSFPLNGVVSVSVGSSTSSTAQPNIQERNQSPQVNATAAVVKDADRSNDQKVLYLTQDNATTSVLKDVYGSRAYKRDILEVTTLGFEVALDWYLQYMTHPYKNQLQSYAQKRNLALPTYSCEREGPPHASRFKCKVTVDGQTYECSTFFPTLKEAEHGAAKVALMSLPSDGDDFMLYKNLLQELAQKQGYALPIYKTNKSGEPHVPTFVSTVEVEGEVFTGQEAKTKKQAEISAAKVAYVTITECKPSQGPKFLSPVCGAQADQPFSYVQSNVAANPHQDIQPTGRMVFNPVRREQAEEVKGNEEDDSQHLLDLFPQPEINPTWKRESSSTDLAAPSVPEIGPSSSSLPSDVSGGTATGPKTRIRVLPYTPNMKIPPGSTVVRRDERFVAFKLGPQSTQ
ncbi:hypothetical protein JRO89_XS04G0116000 [Xanthoceras sorbifolium]|uniref:DRBM domain-containing protein n=1 Tax=Xanthoceras sorbifolium TaxID=99658 RepID=A0ABQ8I534_9ROSI|nr:hypothetical protein JRO89_XS04G0116000 [Xanthoceras sorbifolium]